MTRRSREDLSHTESVIDSLHACRNRMPFRVHFRLREGRRGALGGPRRPDCKFDLVPATWIEPYRSRSAAKIAPRNIRILMVRRVWCVSPAPALPLEATLT